MSDHARFRYKTFNELVSALEKHGLSFPLSTDFDALREPITIGDATAPNRLATQPMEGCDGTAAGRPGELTSRRYRRFAEGGAGVLWFEATAVAPEARANPRQLLLTEDTTGAIKRLFDDSVAVAVNQNGSEARPYTVLQLTHSGRYSRPESQPAPIIATENPYLRLKSPENKRIISDEDLEELEERYTDAAAMACEIGFDAVDIKSCHRYLVAELISARTRNGRYGGTFENRTRFLLNIIDRISSRTSGGINIAVRLNVYDAIPLPYGWGVDKDDHRQYDLDEPIRLVKLLVERGVKLINVTAGNPYFNPHVNRPFDTGPYVPPEHPLEGVCRMLAMARTIRDAAGGAAVMASGFSWLREFGSHAAAGGIRDGWFELAGFGRQAFAYPDFARDILYGEAMARKKCCITCGKCSEIMRFDGMTGCVIRDAEVYGPIYKQASKGKRSLVGRHIAEHV